ncbi:Transcription factor AP-1 [Gryllus bimaculatus]|nr:Transcription factor AP-1 [Gryllus bimaculatus]
METTFYDESFNQRLTSDVNQLKRSMTLDLNQARNIVKRPKYNAAVTGAPVLSSPDLNKLKLGSPELEKFIFAQQSGIMTPTPTQILFPRTVTEEQEIYARGFVDALNELHTNESSQLSSGGLQPVEAGPGGAPGAGAAPSTAVTYTTLEPHASVGGAVISQASSFPASYSLLQQPEQAVVVKDEPQTVPSLGSTPPLSPITWQCQEKIKLGRKLVQRERYPASKATCRKEAASGFSRLRGTK